MSDAAPVHIVVIEDDPEFNRLVVRLLTREGFEVEGTLDPVEGLTLANQAHVDVVLSDVNMPNLTGLELLQSLRKRGSDVEVVLMTGMSSMENAVNAVKAGAFDYLPKPLGEMAHVANVLRRAAERRQLSRRAKSLEDMLEVKRTFEFLVGASPKMTAVFKLVEAVAPTATTVLIQGESGTGKELIARAIHRRSPRANKPFVAVNCSAMTETLLESELFGHMRGAFTGATTTRKGLFQAADHGTLFLDEITDMAPSTQAALLRVLQEGEIRMVGSTASIPVDVRVIAAAHTDLRRLVEQGRFREDLMFRLNVVAIPLPPLRDRKEDIAPLVSHFLRELAARDKRPPLELSEGTMQRMMSHRWPGNVRELENAMERAALLAGPSGQIREEHLPPTVLPEGRDAGSLIHLPLRDARTAVVEAFERRYLREMLSAHDGNITRCAEAAGIARPNFRKLLKQYGLRDSEGPDDA